MSPGQQYESGLLHHEENYRCEAAGQRWRKHCRNTSQSAAAHHRLSESGCIVRHADHYEPAVKAPRETQPQPSQTGIGELMLKVGCPLQALAVIRTRNRRILGAEVDSTDLRGEQPGTRMAENTESAQPMEIAERDANQSPIDFRLPPSTSGLAAARDSLV